MFLHILSNKCIFVVVNAFMINMVLISAAVLVLLVEAWKWGKSFHLDELPEFSRKLVQVEGHDACIDG